MTDQFDEIYNEVLWVSMGSPPKTCRTCKYCIPVFRYGDPGEFDQCGRSRVKDAGFTYTYCSTTMELGDEFDSCNSSLKGWAPDPRRKNWFFRTYRDLLSKAQNIMCPLATRVAKANALRVSFIIAALVAVFSFLLVQGFFLSSFIFMFLTWVLFLLLVSYS